MCSCNESVFYISIAAIESDSPVASLLMSMGWPIYTQTQFNKLNLSKKLLLMLTIQVNQGWHVI